MLCSLSQTCDIARSTSLFHIRSPARELLWWINEHIQILLILPAPHIVSALHLTCSDSALLATLSTAWSMIEEGSLSLHTLSTAFSFAISNRDELVMAMLLFNPSPHPCRIIAPQSRARNLLARHFQITVRRQQGRPVCVASSISLKTANSRAPRAALYRLFTIEEYPADFLDFNINSKPWKSFFAPNICWIFYFSVHFKARMRTLIIKAYTHPEPFGWPQKAPRKTCSKKRKEQQYFSFVTLMHHERRSPEYPRGACPAKTTGTYAPSSPCTVTQHANG